MEAWKMRRNNVSRIHNMMFIVFLTLYFWNFKILIIDLCGDGIVVDDRVQSEWMSENAN